MTRAERAAEKVRKEKEKVADLERELKERLAEQREETRKAEATLREETRKEDNRRRYHWGATAQEAGLFGWSNADWLAVCAVLARLKDTPHPAAVLAGVLCGNGVALHVGESLRNGETLYRAFDSPCPEGENSELPSPQVSGSLSGTRSGR